MQNILHMILNILFLVSVFLATLCVGIGMIKAIIVGGQMLLKKKKDFQKGRFLKLGFSVMILVLLAISAMVMSQWTAFTPKLSGENAISVMKEVTFNGRKQWITLRGENKDAPVLLFIAGGPGGSQLASVRHELSELEKHFVVVGWDQPGSAKSYGAREGLKPSDYVDDGLALTEYLCETLDTDKIYLLGESWGSYLSIMMADIAPQRFHGIINTGQMVDFLETELIDYEKALTLTMVNGDVDKMTRLIKIGKPPYYGVDVTWRSAEYINYLTSEMNRNPDIQNPGYHTDRDLLSSEYGLWDKINYLLGILNTFNDVYQQLYDIDLRETHTQLDVPIAFFIGRHDLNAPTSLAVEYYNLLDAPLKSFVWFEHSGHNPWLNETDQFVQALLEFKANVE